MSLYAFDAIDDAFEATREFLWPFDLGRWARLALVMFFVGGVGGFNPFQFNFGGGSGGPTTPGGPGGPGAPGTPDVLPSLGGPELLVIAAIVGVILLIVLAFLLVGSVMEFVLVESLRREAVTVRRYWGRHWGKGLRLFGFRVVLGLLTLAVFAGIAVLVFAPMLTGAGEFSLGLLLVAIPVFVVVAIVTGLVNGFTTVFVVPIMIAEECGVLSGWSRLWATVIDQWKQYAAYVVMGFVLGLATGIVAFIVTIIAAIAIAIPLLFVGIAGFALLQASPVAGGIVLGIAALLFVLAMIVVSLFVAVPIQTFLRYYALFVLGDTNEAFDLIPERRRAVRGEDASPSDAAA